MQLLSLTGVATRISLHECLLHGRQLDGKQDRKTRSRPKSVPSDTHAWLALDAHASVSGGSHRQVSTAAGSAGATRYRRHPNEAPLRASATLPPAPRQLTTFIQRCDQVKELAQLTERHGDSFNEVWPL